MAFKQRGRKEVDPEALERFASQADFATQNPVSPASNETPKPNKARTVKVTGDLPKSMLIDFKGGKEAAIIQAIKDVDERSKQFIALKALRIGLEQIASELNIDIDSL